MSSDGTSRTRMKVALALAYFVFAILLNSVGTVILQAITVFKVTESAAAQLELFKDVTIAVTSFVVASFLPRLGYKNGILAGLAISGLACVLMPLFPTFLTAKMLFLLCGFSFAFVKVAVYSSVGLVTSDSRQHASFMSTVEGLYMVGVLSSAWIFSFFIDSNDPAAPSWLGVYWLLLAICVVVFILVWSTPFVEGAPSGGTSVMEDFQAMLGLMIRPLVCIFVLSAFLYVLIEQGLGTWMPTFNSHILGMPHTLSLQVASLCSLGLAIGRLSAGPVIARIGWYPVLNVCLVAMGVLLLVVLPQTVGLEANPGMTWSTVPTAGLILPLVGLFMAPIYPALSSVMLSSLPKERHSAMTGLIVIFSALGGTTGSMITGYVFEHFDGRQAFYLTLIPIVALMLTLFLFRRLTEAAIARQEDSATDHG